MKSATSLSPNITTNSIILPARQHNDRQHILIRLTIKWQQGRRQWNNTRHVMTTVSLTYYPTIIRLFIYSFDLNGTISTFAERRRCWPNLAAVLLLHIQPAQIKPFYKQNTMYKEHNKVQFTSSRKRCLNQTDTSRAHRPEVGWSHNHGNLCTWLHYAIDYIRNTAFAHRYLLDHWS